METWMTIWKAVFVVGLAVFAGMAAWVTVQGFLDIRALFSAMRRKRRR